MASTQVFKSRRSFLQLSAAAAIFAGFRMATEPMLAQAARRHAAVSRKDGIFIDSNENPLGPSAAAREAVAGITPEGGRYRDDLSDELIKLFAEQQGLKTDYVRLFAGSSEPLHYTVLAYTSPKRSYVTADPGFEAGIYMSKISGARVVPVPLTKNYAHDVRAMLSAAPDAGVLYICNPNNPTGTLTAHSEIEYATVDKPKDAVVLVDEAYLHFSDAPSALDLVKADKDVIVLRTFSKLYGMAGLRCGFAIGRPDLLERLDNFGGNFMPITAVVAAIASLKDPQLIPERKRVNAGVRGETFQWLEHNGYAYIPSESNCFLVDTKRPAKTVIEAMAQQNVMIGRVWPVMPTWARITVGTQEEMARFQEAFKKVMDGNGGPACSRTLQAALA
ncbi:MAG TPA: pyridoxal phosphate-dependent aminotransferase [Terriglobales bacterium]|nr:pyridoxal phosphate-dependent aminotransferase [Terriglobales bacterium]